MLILKLLISAGVLTMLLCSDRFMSMSRELDDAALRALRKFIRVTEESEDYPENISLLMLLSALLMLAMLITQAGVR